MSLIILEPEHRIVNEEDKDKAEKILFKTEKVCLITNSLKAEFFLKPQIKLAESLVS